MFGKNFGFREYDQKDAGEIFLVMLPKVTEIELSHLIDISWKSGKHRQTTKQNTII